MACLMSVHASNMLYLFVLIFTVILFMLLSVYFQLFRHDTCTIFICLYDLYDSYVLCSHDPYCYGYI
jgi:hypothetical protein